MPRAEIESINRLGNTVTKTPLPVARSNLPHRPYPRTPPTKNTHTHTHTANSPDFHVDTVNCRCRRANNLILQHHCNACHKPCKKKDGKKSPTQNHQHQVRTRNYTATSVRRQALAVCQYCTAPAPLGLAGDWESVQLIDQFFKSPQPRMMTLCGRGAGKFRPRPNRH